MDSRSVAVFGADCTTFCPPEGISFVFPGVPFVRCFFSCVPAGSLSLSPASDSKATIEGEAARERLLKGLRLERWVELQQVHGSHMIVDPLPTPLNVSSTLQGDGVCTREMGLALAIKTADCQPVLMSNREGTAIAALHVGWRGNAANFPASGLQCFCSAYGLHPSDVLAVRGPSLGPGAAQFVNFYKEWSPFFQPWFNERNKTMDLWRLTRHQLIEAGMRQDSVFSLDLCTHSLPDLFFSHRRGHMGRQASLIWIAS
ncbi:MAG: polyphenol oxidase family protein [Desulfovibrio sp.]|jgi:YfiH family protein|nr:polyphenol oxidase family protein [Desulfovibrio sp.]